VVVVVDVWMDRDGKGRKMRRRKRVGERVGRTQR
jgi:hypothetical protein